MFKLIRTFSCLLALLFAIRVGVQAQVEINTPAPGLPLTGARQASTDMPGSVLIYSYYTSEASGGGQNTEFSITNTSHAYQTDVNLYFIDGRTGRVVDTAICLLPTQTAYWSAATFDPGVTGYVIAVAVNGAGWPVAANHLLGSANVKLKTGHAASLPALAVPALFEGPLPGRTNDANKVMLLFDGLHYTRLARTVAASQFAPPALGNAPLLVLARIGGDLTRLSTAPLGKLDGNAFNELQTEVPFTTTETTPQTVRELSDTFPNLHPYTMALLLGSSKGWLRVWGTEDKGLAGALINFNPNAGTAPNSFNGGQPLSTLTQAAKVELTIPVTPSTCDLTEAGDFAVSAHVSPDSIVPGGELTYTVTVTNHGPDAGKFILRHDLRGPATFLSCAASQGGRCATPPYTVGFDTPLPAGQSATVSWKVKVDAQAANGAEVSSRIHANTESVSDLLQGNNYAFVKSTVGQSVSGQYGLSGKAFRNSLPIADAIIFFQPVGNNAATTPAMVKTDRNGNWSQSGFSDGQMYRVGASKPGCLFAPQALLVREASDTLYFVCR